MPREQDWYRLDNAGVLYSALKKEKYAPVYRFSAVMDDRVDPPALQRAVDRSMPRFPSFRVRIRKGVFWCYFEPNRKPGPFVRPDISNPCQPIRDREDNDWLIRFYYYENRISFEAFHAISDGSGALALFRTVLAEYLRERGAEIPPDPLILDVTQPPGPDELEDAYGRYAGKRVLRGKLQKTAYANTSPQEPFYTLNVTMGLMSVAAVKAKAGERGATITEYLTAVLLLSLMEKQRAERPHREKPVALAIPVNLRGWFSSETLRNFMLTLRPCIDPSLGEYSLEELIQYVHHFMGLSLNRLEMRAVITGNVRFTRNRFLQMIPLFLKKPIMAFSYWLVAVRPYTATFTNPGAVRLPASMARHIRRMEVILGQATRPSPHCAAISCGDVMEVTFAGTGTCSETERRFFTHLIREGVPVKVISNRNRQEKAVSAAAAHFPQEAGADGTGGESMSYCVNCGVELDSTAAFCPLCQTPVYNPGQPVDRDGPAPFPAERGEVPLTSQWELAVLISAMLGSVALCCGLLNLFLRTSHVWSAYVIGAAAMLWVFAVPPLLWRKLPLPAAALLDGLAVGLYVLLIAWELDGLDWYLHLALPAVVLLWVILLAQVLLLQRRRWSILSTIAMVIASVAVFVVGLELMGDLYFHGAWEPSWSLVVLVVAGALELPLLVVRWVPGLRREARRRFHM